MTKLKHLYNEIKVIKQIPLYNNMDYDHSYHLYINDKVHSVYKRILDSNYIIYGRWEHDDMEEVKSFLDKYKIPYEFNDDAGNYHDSSFIIVEKIYFKEV